MYFSKNLNAIMIDTIAFIGRNKSHKIITDSEHFVDSRTKFNRITTRLIANDYNVCTGL